MAKNRFRQEQEAPMDAYTSRLTAAEARIVRKLGGGVFSEGIRRMIADKAGERRNGPKDRRSRGK